MADRSGSSPRKERMAEAPAQKTASPASERNRKLARDRELAKMGMAVGLGVLTVTGFAWTRVLRPVHVIAGVATVGLSVWHAMLYKNNGKQ